MSAVLEAPVGQAPITGTFAALRIPTYRLFFGGQAISLIGTWMQTVGLGWLVLTVGRGGTALGLVTAVQFLPVLLLAPYAGLWADRLDKRRLLAATQAFRGLVSLGLGLLAVTGTVRLWMVVVVAVLIGLGNAADNPVRQSFVTEMVPAPYLRNAVTLNSVLVNAARAVGPAAAGLLIGSVGVGWCFLVDAGSYAAVLVALALMNPATLHRSVPARRGGGQLREGVRYVRRTPALLVPLIMMALIGTLAYEFTVVLPVLARDTFAGGASTYGWLTSAMGAGAIVGGLISAKRSVIGLRGVTLSAALFGLSIAAAAAAPTLAVELAVLPFVGAASVSFLSAGNSTLQLSADPAYRGRVMALWAVAFLGSTPIGGPIAGVISQVVSPRAGLATGAAACFVAAGVGVLGLRRADRLAAVPLAEPVAGVLDPAARAA